MKAEKKDQKKEQETNSKSEHTSEGHTTNVTGSDTNSKEPTLRSATTDSSRVPKNSNDDLPEGGNVR